jgi:hypothetical protein
MNKIVKISFVLLVILSIASCQKTNDTKSSLQVMNDSIKKIYAPDKRVAIYDISLVSKKNGSIDIIGESDQALALDDLRSILDSKGISFEDHSLLLPDSSVGNTKLAVVNNSVANIRSKAKHSGELATQALLGTVLKVLKIDGSFYLVQTPDGYISWVDHGGVALMNSEQHLEWQNSEKVIFTKTFGFVYQNTDDELQKTGDIVLGAQLALVEDQKDFYKVKYPDNRIGYIKKSEAELYDSWIKDLEASEMLVELQAKELMGMPYLWGGTSSKGMDCSGFTKTVYLMNGYIIPRDASQQIMAGKDIDPDLKFANMEKGDLMFFGRKATDSTKQRVTHVGIWLGNGQGQFIHSASRVKFGSIDPNSTFYDEYNKNRYLGSRRYLDQKDELLINLKDEATKKNIKT